jgi:hypothetical protein
MRRSLLIITSLVLALGVVEGVSYWWMHPAPAGLGEPVLVYRPSRSAGVSPAGKEPAVSNQEEVPAHGSSSTFDVGRSTFDAPSSTTTLLPDVVAKALPSLHCSTGTAARIDRDDDVTIHVAFFEWDLSSSTNVLEAFKHLPEECMGSIGMTLVEKAPPRSFVVRSQRSEDAVRSKSLKVESQKSDSKTTRQLSPSSPSSSSTDLGLSDIKTFDSSSPTLSFDHTVFRDPRGVMVHAFKGTWVSGATDLLGAGVRGGVEQWNEIRWKAAFKRFRPAHARVVQGAVRSIANPDLAWKAFEESMLADLSFQ